MDFPARRHSAVTTTKVANAQNPDHAGMLLLAIYLILVGITVTAYVLATVRSLSEQTLGRCFSKCDSLSFVRHNTRELQA